MVLKQRRKLGFTLIELMVSISIIVILVGVLIPVLVSAKRSAKDANDLSQLHQLGLAGSLYVEQSGPYFPRSCALLPESGLGDKVLCSAMNDPVSDGAAALVAVNSQAPPLGPNGLAEPFRNSFPGSWELSGAPGFLETSRFEGIGTNIGWLVHIPSAWDRQSMHFVMLLVTKYKRLLRDGSVQNRHMKTFDCVGQKGMTSSILFQVDLSDEELLKLCPK